MGLMREPRLISAGLLAVAVVAVSVSAVGCGHDTANDSAVDAASLAIDPPIVVPPAAIAPEVWAERGALINESDFSDLDAGIRTHVSRATRAVYASVSAQDGSPTAVSGAFFEPIGEPPPGGWPVISLAHGTSGIGNDCGLSMQPDLLGYGGLLNRLLSSGFAVAMTDYQGLGDLGVHPYLEPRTAAFNVIDAVRAMTHISPNVSTRWVALGISQGGQASWASDEFDEFYGGGLTLLGAVAVSPAADVVEIAERAHEKSLTAEQVSVFPLLITGIARYDPDVIASKYLRGSAMTTEYLLRCAPGSKPGVRPTAAYDIGSDSDADTDTLKTALRKIALPQRALSVPLLVINGLNDQTIPPRWVATAVARSCQMGGSIEHDEIPSAGHADLAIPDSVLTWIADRFVNKPAESNCPETK